ALLAGFALACAAATLNQAGVTRHPQGSSLRHIGGCTFHALTRQIGGLVRHGSTRLLRAREGSFCHAAANLTRCWSALVNLGAAALACCPQRIRPTSDGRTHRLPALV